MYNNGVKTAETTFVLHSDEWYLIKPDDNMDVIIGDTLVIDANTDVDNIVTTWMEGFKLQKGGEKKTTIS